MKNDYGWILKIDLGFEGSKLHKKSTGDIFIEKAKVMGNSFDESLGVKVHLFDVGLKFVRVDYTVKAKRLDDGKDLLDLVQRHFMINFDALDMVQIEVE